MYEYILIDINVKTNVYSSTKKFLHNKYFPNKYYRKYFSVTYGGSIYSNS